MMRRPRSTSPRPKAAVLQAAKSGVLKSTNQAMHGDEPVTVLKDAYEKVVVRVDAEMQRFQREKLAGELT